MSKAMKNFIQKKVINMAEFSFSMDDHKEEVKEEMRSKVASCLEAIGMDAASTAQSVTPVDTGRLKNSISYVVDEQEHVVYIGTNVEYAPYQEYGTSRGIKGKHFLQFGVTAHVAEYRSIFQDTLNSG